MRAVLQRVDWARVYVGDEMVAHIEIGVLILLGVMEGDDIEAVQYLAHKVAGLRIFEDEAGKMNRSLSGVGGRVLAVSQFTLAGDVRKGRRPSFARAARPLVAQPLFNRFCELLQAEGIIVERGKFGEHMRVELVNDGPVTIWLDTAELMSR